MNRGKRTITARHHGTCSGCGCDIRPGTRISGSQGAWYHLGCVPSHSPRLDAEYYAGIRDAENFRENRMLFGEEVAEAMEIENELRFGEW